MNHGYVNMGRVNQRHTANIYCCLILTRNNHVCVSTYSQILTDWIKQIEKGVEQEYLFDHILNNERNTNPSDQSGDDGET